MNFVCEVFFKKQLLNEFGWFCGLATALVRLIGP